MSGKAKRTQRRNNTLDLRFLSLCAIAVVLAIVFGMLNNNFFGINNLTNIIRQSAVLAILSIGMTFVILTGGIDLSVGSNLALGGALAVTVYNMTNGNVFLSFLVAIVSCTLVGLLNGILVAKLHISAFIATLAVQFAARGLTMVITSGNAIKIDSAAYRFLSQGDVFGVVPVVLFLIAALFVVFMFLCDRTVYGRQIYALGGNKTAARAMGVRVVRREISTYVLTGLLAGIAAIVTVGRVSSAQPTAGNGLEFDVIIAVVIGGTSLSGGVGSLSGTIFGCIIMGFISNGMGLQNTQPYAEYIIKGILILLSVYFDIFMRSIQQRRLVPEMEKKEVTHTEEAGLIQKLQSENTSTVVMKNITKTFPGMKALDDVSLTIRPGSVMALMGENGAGKSTLMKILAGEERPTDGAIYINDHYVDITSPAKAAEVGIVMIHQELTLVSELTVAQNMFLCREIKGAIPGFISTKKMEKKAKEMLDLMGRSISPKKLVKDLTVSEQQMVEIAKALCQNARLLILDEPTSSLTEVEKEFLFKTMRKLREDGVSMVYISHRMQEIFEIADDIAILRDGQFISSGPVAEYTEQRLIKEMVGRELNNIFDREKAEKHDVVLEVRNLCRSGVFENVSFTVKSGEVVGLSGLMGAGRTEIAKSIFGIDPYDSGEILINGETIRVREPADAMKHGIVYVPEDRRMEGFVPVMSIKNNLCIPSYGNIQKMGVIDRKQENEISDRYIRELNIRTTSADKNVVELSGGNQQKVSLGKWLALNPKVLILDEPTRGIDVGAKAEIHKIIENLAKQGMAIILISSELPEIIGCSDRAIILRGGNITGEFAENELEQDALMEKAAYTASEKIGA